MARLQDKLSQQTQSRFLFRVHTPKGRTLASGSSGEDVYFLSAKFDERFNSSAVPLPQIWKDDPSLRLQDIAGYDDVVDHLDWTRRVTSPFISASANISWTIWEAIRRFRHGVKHDVEIAVIDATLLGSKTVSVADLLKKAATAEERHADHNKWKRFAEDSQSHLIHGYVPYDAVIVSVPLLSVIPHLPSYFFASPEAKCEVVASDKPTSSLSSSRILSLFPNQGNVAYRKFVSDITARWKDLTMEDRLRDITVGSVELTLSLLTPWFETQVCEGAESCSRAIATTSEMAKHASSWSSSELAEISGAAIEKMIRLVSDEMVERKAENAIQHKEISRLSGLVDALNLVVEEYQRLLASEDEDDSVTVSGPETRAGTPASEIDDNLIYSPSLTAVHSTPSSPSPYATKFVIPPLSLDDQSSPPLKENIDYFTPIFRPPLVKHIDMDSSYYPLSKHHLSPIQDVSDEEENASSSDEELRSGSGSSSHSRSSSISHSSSSTSPSSFHPDNEAIESPTTPKPKPSQSPPDYSDDSLHSLEPDQTSSLHNELDTSVDASEKLVLQELIPESTTVSSLVTGFLIGAFVALCLLTPQRRALLIAV